jgi:hypothetical protein
LGFTTTKKGENMKKFAAFIAFCFLALALTSSGQTSPNQAITITFLKTSVEDEHSFYSDSVDRNDKTRETQFVGNVSFKSKKLEFSGAEKVIFNEATMKMTIYGCQDFVTDGKFVIKNGGKLRNILEYTIGNDKVYLF